MSDVLYVQTEKNVEVHQPEVYLQDVAKLSSSSTSVLNRNRVRKVFTVPDGKPGRYVVSALELVEAIQDKEQSVDVTHIGEANFVITYETQKHGHVLWSWMKTALVCFLTFFGGAFSIMTFNMDVDTSGLFIFLTSFISSSTPFWNLPIPWESALALYFSSIISDMERSRRTLLLWKYRCVSMRMM